VTPASPAIASGSAVTLVATGNFSDGTTQNLTTSVTWASSVSAVASVSAQGVVSGLGKGQTSISATLGSTVGSTTLTVSDAVLTAIAITPAIQSVAAGTNLQLVATGTYSDNTTQDITSLVSWTSSDATLATVSSGAGSRGLARGIAPGPATITAVLGAVSGTAMLTITNATLSALAVTPATQVIASGTNQQFTATGIYSDGTTANLTDQVAWSSSSSAVATISNAAGSLGLCTGASLGAVTITATSGTVTGSATLAISNATLRSIQVTAANTAIALGTSEQFTATGIYSDGTSQDITSLVTWDSTLATVASLSNSAGSRGLCTSVAAGSTSITAALGAVTGSRGLTVTSATLSSIAVTPGGSFLAKGTQQQFTATGIFSDGNQQDLTATVSWSSSAGAIASIDNSAGSEGLLTALAAGTATITATDLMSGKSGTTRVTVTSALLTSIAITPSTPSIAKGTSVQLTATGTYNDGRKQDLTALVTWTSSGTGVSVSNTVGTEGLAQGVTVGTVVITARLSGTTGTTMLTVTSATLVSLSVTPANAELPVAFYRQYVATGLYSDGSTQVLTSDSSLSWTSSDMSLATISNVAGSEGLALGVAAGAVNITATVGAISGTTRLTVTSANLMTITVMPATANLAVGGTQQFTALATFDDGLTLDVTASVTWASDDMTLVSIDPASGLATAVAAGAVTITATIGTIIGMATVTVS